MKLFKNLFLCLFISNQSLFAIAFNQELFSGFEINDEITIDSSDNMDFERSQDEDFYIMYPKNFEEILRPIKVTYFGSQLIHEDDIIIGPSENFEMIPYNTINAPTSEVNVQFAGVATGTLSSRKYRWYDSVIPFEIDSSFNDDKVKAIVEAANLWSQKTNLMLINISDHLEDYHESHIFRKGRIKFVPHDSQCSSYVGMRVQKTDDFGKWQEINIAQGCYSKQILHEIGHAIGLFHEQTRSDRDLYIDVHKDNIQDDKYSQYNKNTKYNSINLSDYDFNSIMHYSNRGFAKGNDATFTVKEQYKSRVNGKIGTHYGLSKLDIESVNKIYPNKPLKEDSYYFLQTSRSSAFRKPSRATEFTINLEVIAKLLKSRLPLNSFDVLGKFNCKPEKMGSTSLAKCTGKLSKSSNKSTKSFEAKVSLAGSSPAYVIYMR